MESALAIDNPDLPLDSLRLSVQQLVRPAVLFWLLVVPPPAMCP